MCSVKGRPPRRKDERVRKRRVSKQLGAPLLAVLMGAMVLGLAGPASAAPKPKPTYSLKANNYNVSENTSPALIGITRNPKGTGTVHFRTAGGTATAGPVGSLCTDDASYDYIAVADQAVAFSNQSSRNAEVTICNNNTFWEGPETVILQLFNPPSGTTISRAQATLVINDDDPRPTLAISDSDPTSVTEGGSLDFTVTLSDPASYPISVDWATQDGSAEDENGDGDYTSDSGTFTWPPFDTSDRILTINTTDNYGYDLPQEAFTVVLSNAFGAGVGDATGTGLIDNDDEYASITGGDAWEGDPVPFTISVTNSGSGAVLVGSTDGTATGDTGACGSVSGQDYQQVGGFGLVPTGFTVTTCEDTDVESNETFTVTLLDSSGVDIDPTAASATGTIKDDEPAALDLTLDPSSASSNTDSVDATAHVTNTDGDALDGVLVRFEYYKDLIAFDGTKYNQVNIGGPGGAGFDLTNDDQDVDAVAYAEDPGDATVQFGGGSVQSRTAVVACVVDAIAATPTCGVATDGDDPDDFYNGNNTNLSAPPNATTDKETIDFPA